MAFQVTRILRLCQFSGKSSQLGSTASSLGPLLQFPLTVHPLEKGPYGSCIVNTKLFFADVPTWLKSLRLHKYASLFSTMTYDEMMSLTEEQLEAQVCALSCL